MQRWGARLSALLALLCVNLSTGFLPSANHCTVPGVGKQCLQSNTFQGRWGLGRSAALLAAGPRRVARLRRGLQMSAGVAVPSWDELFKRLPLNKRKPAEISDEVVFYRDKEAKCPDCQRFSHSSPLPSSSLPTLPTQPQNTLTTTNSKLCSHGRVTQGVARAVGERHHFRGGRIISPRARRLRAAKSGSHASSVCCEQVESVPKGHSRPALAVNGSVTSGWSDIFFKLE
eukprot:2604683-Rhodomonas_salina.1